MTLDLKKLSIVEIKRELLNARSPLSDQILNDLENDSRQGVRKLYCRFKRRQMLENNEHARVETMLNIERTHWESGVRFIAGVDEVGVGPLAGPVVAAAVVFKPDVSIKGINDSKLIDARRRRELANTIRNQALAVGVGQADVDEIDRLNIYHAALLAMRRAVESLSIVPERLLVDARIVPGLTVPQDPIIKGDRISFSIAAASIIAKTFRDQLMSHWDSYYPEYGFIRHKGYGTREHQEAIRRLGPCPLHRSSYTFMRELQGEYSGNFYELQRGIARIKTDSDFICCEQKWNETKPILTGYENKKIKSMLVRRKRTI